MLLKLAEELRLDAAPEEVWKILRDTPRLTGLVPGVEDVTALAGQSAEAYRAKARDKIGPFKIAMDLEVRVSEVREPSPAGQALLIASVKGLDSSGGNRVSGSLEIALNPASSGTRLRFEASIEILGKLATLGAIPIRRRTTQMFAEFARNIEGQFAPESL